MNSLYLQILLFIFSSVGNISPLWVHTFFFLYLCLAKIEEIIQRENFCGKKLKSLNGAYSHTFSKIIESNIHILILNNMFKNWFIVLLPNFCTNKSFKIYIVMSLIKTFFLISCHYQITSKILHMFQYLNSVN